MLKHSEEIMVEVINFAAGLVVALRDPIFWLMIVGGVALGIAGYGWWTALALAVGATMVIVTILFGWWQQIGVADRWLQHAIATATRATIWSLAAWGLGRFFRLLRSRATPRFPGGT